MAKVNSQVDLSVIDYLENCSPQELKELWDHLQNPFYLVKIAQEKTKEYSDKVFDFMNEGCG